MTRWARFDAVGRTPGDIARQAEAIADDAVELAQAGDEADSDRMLAHVHARALVSIAYSLDRIADVLSASRGTE